MKPNHCSYLEDTVCIHHTCPYNTVEKCPYDDEAACPILVKEHYEVQDKLLPSAKEHNFSYIYKPRKWLLYILFILIAFLLGIFGATNLAAGCYFYFILGVIGFICWLYLAKEIK